MEAYFLTDQGQVRGHNEDSGGIYYNSSGQLLAVIADGMGGHQAGDVASEMAVSIIQRSWKESKELNDPEEVESWLSHILFYINNEIFALASQREEYGGMGTTIVVVIHCGHFFTVAHIGDSRCYLKNANGFNQITEDHSLVNELVRTGQISKADAEQHPRKNIVLRALGTEINVEADIRSLNWEIGDKLLLCSDGLTDKISNDKILEYLKSEGEIEQISQNLIDLANERGGEDNISLIIIHHITPKKVGEGTC